MLTLWSKPIRKPLFDFNFLPKLYFSFEYIGLMGLIEKRNDRPTYGHILKVYPFYILS